MMRNCFILRILGHFNFNFNSFILRHETNCTVVISITKFFLSNNYIVMYVSLLIKRLHWAGFRCFVLKLSHFEMTTSEQMVPITDKVSVIIK